MLFKQSVYKRANQKKLKHLKVESIIKNLQQELHQFSFRDPMRGIYPRQHTPGSLEHTNTHDSKVVIHGDSKVRGFRHDQLGADLRADSQASSLSACLGTPQGPTRRAGGGGRGGQGLDTSAYVVVHAGSSSAENCDIFSSVCVRAREEGQQHLGEELSSL